MLKASFAARAVFVMTVKVIEEGVLDVPEWHCVIPYEIREVSVTETERYFGQGDEKSGQSPPVTENRLSGCALPSVSPVHLSQFEQQLDHQDFRSPKDVQLVQQLRQLEESETQSSFGQDQPPPTSI
jgi:hypothetical protein